MLDGTRDIVENRGVFTRQNARLRQSWGTYSSRCPFMIAAWSPAVESFSMWYNNMLSEALRCIQDTRRQAHLI
jgi:hypothetical protein